MDYFFWRATCGQQSRKWGTMPLFTRSTGLEVQSYWSRSDGIRHIDHYIGPKCGPSPEGNGKETGDLATWAMEKAEVFLHQSSLARALAIPPKKKAKAGT